MATLPLWQHLGWPSLHVFLERWVMELYALLLEHTICVDNEGYKEVQITLSLQPLIANGKTAATLLLAQLAFRLGQGSHAAETSEGRARLSSGLKFPPSTTRMSLGIGNEQMNDKVQTRWQNMVQLAFIAANLVSEDISTTNTSNSSGNTLIHKGDDLPGNQKSYRSGLEARYASAAASSIPIFLCSSPTGYGSLALSAQVLGMFPSVSQGPLDDVRKLCSSHGAVPDQGILMWPLLRLSIFLLARLHPCTQSAQINASRLEGLVKTLLTHGWETKSSQELFDNDDMCMVVLAHITKALIRLKGQVSAVVNHSPGTQQAFATHGSGVVRPKSPFPPADICAASAHDFEKALFTLLQCLTTRRRELLNEKLGETCTSTFIGDICAEVRRRSFAYQTESQCAEPVEQADGNGSCWDTIARNLDWMDECSLFASADTSCASGSHGLPDLLESYMSSFKGTEALERCAVEAGAERSAKWQDVVSHNAEGILVEDCPEGPPPTLLEQGVLRTIGDQADEAKTLVAIKTERRLQEASRRLRSYKRVFSAAWSPWTRGFDQRGTSEPLGWEVSSHKDQRMRQMLLVPVDRNVRHMEASYYRSSAKSQDSCGANSPQEQSPGDAALLNVPAVRPSAAVLGGEVGCVDDEEDERRIQNELLSPADETYMSLEGVEESSRDWERPRQSIAVQAEIEVKMESISIQPALDDIRQAQHLSDVANGRTIRQVGGKWNVLMVLRECSVSGTLYVFTETLVFISTSDPSKQSCDDKFSSSTRHHGETWCWQLRRLTQLHLRRFLLSPKAVELFWADSPEVFLAFEGVHQRQAFTRALRKQHVPMLPATTLYGSLHPRKVLEDSKLTEMWRRRQISNFQYIMELNIVAGRSYNDITQYPVFPWILSDYSSTQLDLNSPQSFRDLRKPVGALNEERRKLFVTRYSAFEDDMIPKFMYGTHYSSAGVVLHYLVRQEPFTSLHIQLQDGTFDCPDRLFQDIKQCWSGCVNSNGLSDVKELTPEFFYFPEIFLNTNKQPLGELQANGGMVDDVRLPPWAKDPYEFVRLHRLALESEHVSRHLHHWIDLIFGYKQRGHEAVKAANIFYYLTYEGAVDLSQVDDPQRREAMELQIRHFGQTPCQLLLEPHPVRMPIEECVLPLFSSRSALDSLRVYSPQPWPPNRKPSAILLVHCTEERLVCVDAALQVTTWAWSGLPNRHGQPFTLGRCKTSYIPSRALHMSNVYSSASALPTSASNDRTVRPACPSDFDAIALGEENAWFKRRTTSLDSCTTGIESKTEKHEVVAIRARGMGRMHSCFALRTARDGDPESIISCGYWDHAIRRHFVDASTKLSLGATRTGGHQGPITCLCMTEGGSLLVTGGEDATCRVWVVGNAPMASALRGMEGTNAIHAASEGDKMVCVRVLYGHEAPVVSIAMSEELDATVSGASDGRIVLHCLKDGSYVRCFSFDGSYSGNEAKSLPEASQLALSCHGDIIAHSWDDLSLHRFSLNGAHLATGTASTVVSCLLTTGGGEYLLTGGQDGTIGVYALHNLRIVHSIRVEGYGGVTCIQMSANKEYLLAGSENGEVSIITDTKTRFLMLDLALSKHFVG